jgi:hypothetical protein
VTRKPTQAKLPPDPQVIADLKHFRENAKELVQIGMSIARAIGNHVNAEAAPKAGQDPVQDTAAAPKQRAAKQERTPKPAAETAPPRAQTPVQAFATVARVINACIDLYKRLSDAIATAHTTVEFAALNHPHRQAILDYMHEAIRFDEPYQLQRMQHKDIEIRVSEELAYAPNRNPGDIIAELCTHYRLPHNPEHYPNDWRPTRDWADVPGNPPPGTEIREVLRPDPEIENPEQVIATVLSARANYPNL